MLGQKTPWTLGCECVCVLKDQCGLSGLRDEDKIAEGVMICDCLCILIVSGGCLNACCVRNSKTLGESFKRLTHTHMYM